MKILEAIYATTLGGSETLSLSLAKAFEAAGHECDILTTYRGDESFLPTLDNCGLNVFHAGFDGRSIKKRLLVPAYLFNLFRKGGYDVVHCHHMPVLIHCLRPARLAGVGRVVLTEHAHQHYKENSKFFRRSKLFGPRADMTTVIHKELYDFFETEIGTPASRLTLIENSIDAEKFSPGQSSVSRGKSGDWDFVFGSVARLHKDKDFPNLLYAISRLAKNSDHKFGVVIVGDGPERTRLENLAAELGVSDKLMLCGTQHNIADWLRIFDVFVLPSRREGLPLAILEAMSSGTPIVATSVGGIPDVVNDAVGRLVPREDPESLSNALLEIMTDRNLRESMAIHARDYVLRNYSFDEMVSRYLDAFR